MRFFKKLGIIGLGLSMALGVGISLGVSNSNVVETKAAEVSDVLTVANTGATGTSYSSSTYTSSTTGVSYNFYNAAGNNSIQLRSNGSNSGIVTTSTIGKIVSVTVVWNSLTSSSRVLNIYGSTTAYTAPTELYGTVVGTKCGSIAQASSTVYTFDSPYAYDYVGIRSNSGALYLDSVTITYSSSVVVEKVVTDLSVSASASSFTAGDVIAAATYSATATVDGTPNTPYTNYIAEIGSKSGDVFTKRATVIFGTTTYLANDNSIKFTANDGNGASGHAEFYSSITVSAPNPTSLTATPSSVDVGVGGSSNAITISATPAEASNAVSWSVVGTAGIASVSDGVVTGIAIGTTTIRATSTVVDTVYVDIPVEVKEIKNYVLITNLAELEVGKSVLIAGYDNSNVLGVMGSTQNVNNRSRVSPVAPETDGSINYASGMAEFILGAGTTTATAYSFRDDNGYLCAASSSSNYLHSETTLSAEGEWNITLTEGVFKISATGTYTRNTMRYNYSSSIFSAYVSTSTTGSAVMIYQEKTANTAATLASYIMASDTEGQCVTKFPVAKARYLDLSASEKALFVATSEDATIRNAVARYEAWAVNQGELPYAEGSSSVSHFGEITNSSAIITVVVISVIGLTSVAGFFFLNKKRKETN